MTRSPNELAIGSRVATQSASSSLRPAIADIEKKTNIEVKRIHVAKGYRGHNHPNKFRGRIPGQVKGTTAAIKCEMKRRASIEPMIGHLEAKHRNCLKGRSGDRMNALLAAVGLNFHQPLRWFAALLWAWCQSAPNSGSDSILMKSGRQMMWFSRRKLHHAAIIQTISIGSAGLHG